MSLGIMKMAILGHRKYPGLTRIEVLVVAALCFILIALLLPVGQGPRTNRPTKVKIEEAELINAINAYVSEYGHWPLPNLTTNEDVTCGADSGDLDASTSRMGVRWIASNADLMIVLMDLNQGVNTDHKMNPKWIKFLNVRFTNDTNSSGVSSVDYQFRDVWGHPYIISLDANGDRLVRDGFYANNALYSNRSSAPLLTNGGYCELPGHVMVWSRGPDGKASLKVPAHTGVNRDNITSWQ